MEARTNGGAISIAVRITVCAAVLFLVGCAGTTKIKYIYALAGTQIERPSDGLVLTAPPGKHYAVFLVSCVDNSDRDDTFGFSTTRLRTDSSNADSTPLSGQFPPTSFGVPAGGIQQAAEDQSLARVVFLIDEPAQAGVKGQLFHNSQSGQSVLMVNQTPYGPLVSAPGAVIRYDEITGSPFLGSDTCVDYGSYH
jgi:hypothetical protein